MASSRNAENRIKLLQSPLLRLRHDEKDHKKRENIQAGVEAECSHWCDFGEQGWEGDSEGAADGVVDADGEGGADFAVGEGEGFGEVD